MARITNSVTGALSGSIGPIVATSWKGIPIVRTKPKKGTKRKSTEAQAATRIKFGVATRFLRSMRDLLEIGFQNEAIEKTGTNAAISYTMKHAIKGNYPDFSIACDRVLISRGCLNNAATCTVSPAANETLQFTWTNAELTGKATLADKAILVAYSEEYGDLVYNTGPERGAGTAILEMPAFKGIKVHTWFSFISADEKDVATSMYCGEVVIE